MWANEAQEALPAPVVLDPVVVTAWHFDTNPLDTPADVTVIGADQIEGYGAASIPEVLRTEANVLLRTVSGRPGNGQLSLRGFGENSGLRVLVLVDGQRFNRPDLGGLDWQQIPLAEVERIEVIRGGQSALYGDQALAGVIKITTRAASAPSEARAQVALGSYDFSHVTVGARFREGGAFVDASYNVFSDDGYRANAATHGSGARLSAGYGPVQASFSYQEIDRNLPGPLTIEEYEEDARQSTTSGEHIDEESWLGSLLWEESTPLGPSQAELGLFARDSRWSLGVDAENEQFTATLSPRQRFEIGRLGLTGGFDGRYSEIDFTEFYNGNEVPEADRFDYVAATADLSRVTLAPYLLGDLDVREGLTVVAGGRYEWARTRADYRPLNEDQVYPYRPTNRDPNAPNPDFREHPDVVDEAAYDETFDQTGWSAEGALHWRPWEPLGSWLRANRVYRYPVLDEVASYQGFPLSQPFNPDLKPETGWQIEAGGKFQQGPWRAGLTLFALWLKDEIYFDPSIQGADATVGSGLNVNYSGTTRRIGASPSVGYDQGLWGAQVRGTFVDARFVDGENSGRKVPLIPSIYAAASLWLEPLKGYRVTLDANYQGERFQGNDETNDQPELEAFALLDFRFQARLNAHLMAYGKISNLLDTEYLSTGFAGGVYPGRGRYFEVGVHLSLR